ncbi:hypothetical protein [Pectobacterium brasiliense]|uniref:hypothetical protein n=1 Tax=Pectobacterium brasiliense TaxID=180957 RepID=UPI0032EEA947
MNTEGTAKRRDLPQKARGRGATAIEPPRVGRVRRKLQKKTVGNAHETFVVTIETASTVTTETTKGDISPFHY